MGRAGTLLALARQSSQVATMWALMALPGRPHRDELRQLHVVAHTHWDREWWDTVDGFHPRLVQLVERLLPLLEDNPDFASFTFDGQIAPIDDYLQGLEPSARAAAETRIRRLVEAGRLQLGPWYTLSDQFLVSGETTLRNLERGIARARQLGGVMNVAHCPDQFGLCSELPKILRHAGISRVVAQRGLSRDQPRRFRWRTNDGSEVDVVNLKEGYFQRHPGLRRMRVVARRAHGNAALMLAGYDHSLPTAEIAATARRAGAHLSSLPAFFDSLGPPAADAAVITGELRSVGDHCLLPNVVSNRVDQRLAVSQAERSLERYAEPLAAFALDEYPRDELDRAWQNQIWNAAHDSACATGIDAVTRDVLARAATTSDIATQLIQRSLAALGSRMSQPGDYVWNPSSFERNILAGPPGARQLARSVPPLGWARLEAAAEQPAQTWLPPLRLTDQRERGDTYTTDPRGRERDIPLTPSVETVADEPFTRVTIAWQNTSQDHRVRLRLKLPETATRSITDTAFGHVERPAIPDPVQGRDRMTGNPAPHYIVAGGIAVLLDRTAEYEIDPRTNELVITLLRAHGALSVANPRDRLGPAGPCLATTETQLPGAIGWELAVMPWPDATALPTREWERFALPGVAFHSDGGGRLPAYGSGFRQVPQGEFSAVLSDRTRSISRESGAIVEAPLQLSELAAAGARQRLAGRSQTDRQVAFPSL